MLIVAGGIFGLGLPTMLNGFLLQDLKTKIQNCVCGFPFLCAKGQEASPCVLTHTWDEAYTTEKQKQKGSCVLSTRKREFLAVSLKRWVFQQPRP